MLVRNYLELLLYLGLSVCATIFVKKSVDEYIEGNTGYSETHEPLSMHDNPTLMFCYLYDMEMDPFHASEDVYGTHFEITAYGDWNAEDGGNERNLSENYSVQFPSGINMSLSKFWHPGHDLRDDMNCYKITTEWNGSYTDMTQVQISYRFRYIRRVNYSSIDARIIFTSEENSYGVGLNRWFDGDVSPIMLKKDSYNQLKVLEVTEYHNLKGTCSQNSYFQCLAKHFLNFNPETAHKTRTVMGSYGAGPTVLDCTESFKKMCYPFSMPFADINIPICANNIDRQCYGSVLKEIAKAQEGICLKSCKVKEYKITSETYPGYGIKDILVDYKFGFPLSTRAGMPMIIFSQPKHDLTVSPSNFCRIEGGEGCYQLLKKKPFTEA